jgi:hypothetical protein
MIWFDFEPKSSANVINPSDTVCLSLDLPSTKECHNCSNRLVHEFADPHQQKKFYSGGIAPSEWTHSVKAIRDTSVADYSAPVGIITRHIAYLPPIADSPFPSHSVGLLLETITLALWPAVTICQNGFIGYALLLGLQCDG